MNARGDLRGSSGIPIDREGSTLLGRGGEARVWSLPASGKALKILEPHARTAERLRVLEHLVARTAPALHGAEETQPWGWPEELVFEDGLCVGYTMRAFRQRRTLFSVLVPTERMRVFPAFDARHLHRVGANLARALTCLHDADIVVGDLSESNVLVAADASVALVDVDSFQFVNARGDLFPCPVGKPELLAPEHHGEFFAATPKTPASDAFSFAVLLFQLLFDGPHPFSGVFRGAGPCPTPAEALLAGDYVFSGTSRLTPRLGMPGIEAIQPEIAHAFERTFVAGLHRPELRTSVKTWVELLERAELGLVRCTRNRAHLHPSVARQCAYCTRAEHFGRAFETFAHVNADELPPATKPSLPPAVEAPAMTAAVAGTSDSAVASAIDATVEAAPESRRAPRLARHARSSFGKRRAMVRAHRLAVEVPTEPQHVAPPPAPPPVRARTDHGAAPPRTFEPSPRVPRSPASVEAAPRATAAATASARAPRRYALLAALVAAFALGRCTGPHSSETQEASRVRSSAVTPATVAASANGSTPAPRSSAVPRREAPVAEKKTPRTPR